MLDGETPGIGLDQGEGRARDIGGIPAQSFDESPDEGSLASPEIADEQNDTAPGNVCRQLPPDADSIRLAVARIETVHVP